MLRATNNSGTYGVPGTGVFAPGETRDVDTRTAAWLLGLPEFTVEGFGPRDDLPFREGGKPRYLGYTGAVSSTFGYGYGSVRILRALTELGVEVAANPVYYEYRQPFRTDGDTPPDVVAQLVRRTYVPKWEIAQCLPDAYPYGRASRRIGWTMWEMDRIPDGSKYSAGAPFGDWARLINEYTEHLVVPSRHNAAVFAACGVKTPITVIPYGVDGDEWPYFDRPERDTFTVVMFGDLTSRKAPAEAFRAFQEAFPVEKDVRLILKSHYGHFGAGSGVPIVSDPRIAFIDAVWDRTRLVQFLHDADCFVWPSRGEGFGLPPLQALLTGLPVVMTTHTGMAEYYDPRYFYAIETAGTSPAPLYGDWYDPDITSIALQLRRVYERRKEALARGKRGAVYVRKHWSAGAFATRLGALLETLE